MEYWFVRTFAETWVLFEWFSLGIVPWLAPMLSYSRFVSLACYQVFVTSWIMLNDLYYNTSYLRNRGGFIKVRSIIGVQVFFLHLRAEGCAECATKGAIGFQEVALIPAEEENPDEEEQDWDWDQDPVDPFVGFFIWRNVLQYSQLILTVINFSLRLTNTFWTRFSCVLIRRWCCLRCS